MARVRLRMAFEQQPFAQAVGREDHPLDLQALDQPLQHGGRVGQGLDAPLGDALDPLQRASGLPDDEAGGIERVVRLISYWWTIPSG